MSTQKNEHNPDGLPEMEEFRFLCIGETFQKGDEFWNRQTKQWEESWNYISPETTPVEQSDWTYRRRITPPTDTTGSGSEGETGCGPKSGHCAECGTTEGALVLLEDTTLCEECNMADHVVKLRLIDELTAQVEALRRDGERLTWLIKQGPPGAADGFGLNDEVWDAATAQVRFDYEPGSNEASDQMLVRAAIDSAQRQEGA